MTSFAEILRRLRARAGWTQAELAERIDSHYRTINCLESGQRPNPTLSLVLRLLREFGESCAILDTVDMHAPVPPVRPRGAPAKKAQVEQPVPVKKPRGRRPSKNGTPPAQPARKAPPKRAKKGESS